ncbi:hypothetical protein F2P79_021464 [Pimephales promelas]|nr:hypothetical protein F2P79_021464 [Pimephales promelas]
MFSQPALNSLHQDGHRGVHEYASYMGETSMKSKKVVRFSYTVTHRIPPDPPAQSEAQHSRGYWRHTDLKISKAAQPVMDTLGKLGLCGHMKLNT